MEREPRIGSTSPSPPSPPLHPFRAFSSAYFLPRRGCRSCHKFRQPWRVSYFEYEMNYVPLLPDMAYYGMGGGGYSSLNALLSFLFLGGRGREREMVDFSRKIEDLKREEGGG